MPKNLHKFGIAKIFHAYIYLPCGIQKCHSKRRQSSDIILIQIFIFLRFVCSSSFLIFFSFCWTGKLVVDVVALQLRQWLRAKPRKLSVDVVKLGSVRRLGVWKIAASAAAAMPTYHSSLKCASKSAQLEQSQPLLFFGVAFGVRKVTGASLCKCQNPSTSMYSCSLHFLHFSAANYIQRKSTEGWEICAGSGVMRNEHWLTGRTANVCKWWCMWQRNAVTPNPRANNNKPSSSS